MTPDPGQIVWFDFETELIAPGNVLPRPAIATTYRRGEGARLWLTKDLDGLLDRTLDACLAGTAYLGGHDLARFDCGVIAQHFPRLRPKLWAAFEADRIVDTLVAERICEIHRGERGGLALDVVAMKHGVAMKSKADAKDVRLSFGQFIGADAIPAAHAEYALQDAIVCADIFERQLATGLVDQSDLAELCRQSFALSLVAARGFRTDVEHVRKLEALLSERIGFLEGVAKSLGFLKTDRKGNVSRHMAAIHEAIARDYAPEAFERYEAEKAFAAEGEAVFDPFSDPRIPKTKTGRVAADRLTLEDSQDPKLQTLSEWAQLLSIRNKDLPLFYQGAVEPLHTRFGIADTTRATHSSPNQANFGKAKGVRECIAARPGFALAVSDFRMLELVSLAQLCVERLGVRNMAQKINDGIDLHAEVGADVLGITYDEIKARMAAGDPVAKDARDSGKPANFGLNGGMQSAETFQLYARKSYKQKLTIEQCQAVMAAWRRRAHDQQRWLAHVRASRLPHGLYDVKHPGFKNLYRRGVRYTEAANGPFQIYGARATARALWLVIKQQYCTGELAGSHVVMVVHDDLTTEIPLDRLEYAERIEALMCQGVREVLPEAFAGAETRVLTHLSRDAKATRAADGQLGLTHVGMPARLGA